MLVAKRVMKGYEERRGELLATAAQLFCENGYEATPVNAIIDAAGVSKGTFYHYFQSKEQLLDAIAEQMTASVLETAGRAAAKPGLDPVARLNAFFAAAGQWRAEHAGLVVGLTRALHRDENVLLRHKITRRSLAGVAPRLGEVIADGVARGVFDVPDARDAADLLLRLFVSVRETAADLLLSAQPGEDPWPLIEHRLASCQMAAERILRAPEGSVRFADAEALRALREALGRSGEGRAAR